MTKEQIQALKLHSGKRPFVDRLHLSNDFAKCPFHNGESEKSLHLSQAPDGAGLATCFSDCNQTWDVIAFVQQFDKVPFAEACTRLGQLPQDSRQVKQRPQPVAMTEEKWAQWGKPIESADVEKFASFRSHSHTADLNTFRSLGVRVKDKFLGFPYTHVGNDGRVFTGIKLRKLGAEKEFRFWNATDTTFLFNVDAVNPLEDCYVCGGSQMS